MTQTLLTVFVAFVDLLAVAVACWFALRFANRDVAGILKGLIGVVCGLGSEVLRIGTLALTLPTAMRLVSGPVEATTGLLGFLIALRLWNVPVLVGLAFVAGMSAAATKTLTCPECDGTIQLSAGILRQQAVVDAVTIVCPTCAAQLSISMRSLEALSTKPARTEPPAEP